MLMAKNFGVKRNGANIKDISTKMLAFLKACKKDIGEVYIYINWALCFWGSYNDNPDK